MNLKTCSKKKKGNANEKYEAADELENEEGSESEEETDEDDEMNESDEEEDRTEDEEEEEDGFDDIGELVDTAENNNDVSTKRKLDVQGGKASKSSKTNKSDLYKAPTVEEMNTLREAQTLYHSNLFRMQMDELLSTISLKAKDRIKINQWREDFLKFIQQKGTISEKYEVSDTSWLLKKGLFLPVPSSGMPATKGVFVFAPPTHLEFVGSFITNTANTQGKVIDLMITLPKECVQAGDWLNARWIVKRWQYLSWLALLLKDSEDLAENLSWVLPLGEPYRPVLQIKPSGSLGKKWSINIHPVPPEGVFQLKQFRPNKNTVRQSWFFNREHAEDDIGPVTPHYNWLVGIDLVFREHNNLIKETIAEHPNLYQGIVLLKIWLGQRALDTGYGGFSGHIITMLVVHLLKTRKVTVQMSAYQVFRTCVLMLSKSDWTNEGTTMCLEPSDTCPSLQVFHELYQVVFVDPSGFFNLASTITKADYYRVQYEAKLAIELLDSSSVDSFEALFIKKLEFHETFDQMIQIKLSQKDLNRCLSNQSSINEEQARLDFLGDVRSVIWEDIVKVMREGLGDRINLIAPLRGENLIWPLNEPQPKQKKSLTVGLLLNPNLSAALLTKGPIADDPEVNSFRAFWGEKSLLRRFQDGSFHEAILWGEPKDPLGDRRLIPGTIIKYLMKNHFKLNEEKVLYIAEQTESLIRLTHYNFENKYGTGEEATVAAIQAYNSLTRKLRSIDLPLKITSVHSTSDVLRHSRVFPPLNKAIPKPGKTCAECKEHINKKKRKTYTESFNVAIEMLVFLEISGKWPDEVEAIQAIKAEFHKQLGQQLKNDGVTIRLFPGFLQIFWEGYVFQLSICYRREIYLRRLVETSSGDWKEQDTEEAIRLETEIEILPKVSSALAGIQSIHPSYNGAVRLAKRWASAQLLMPQLPPLAVELLVAQLYLSPAPHAAPHTPHVAFLRLLQFLAKTDWKSMPVLVNLNNDFELDDITELNKRFMTQREKLPHMFVATPYELRRSGNSDDPADVEKTYYSRLLATCVNPGLWLKEVMPLSGIDTSYFMGHSTRVASVNTMTVKFRALLSFERVYGAQLKHVHIYFLDVLCIINSLMTFKCEENIKEKDICSFESTQIFLPYGIKSILNLFCIRNDTEGSFDIEYSPQWVHLRNIKNIVRRMCT
ncbi:unnamed protein product, partial [Meganyctiphanes norvegica]